MAPKYTEVLVTLYIFSASYQKQVIKCLVVLKGKANEIFYLNILLTSLKKLLALGQTIPST